jgi:YggT family protein
MSLGWQLLLSMLDVFRILILVRVVLSWVVSPTSRNPLVEGIRRVTDTVLEPLSRVIPPMGGLDLSPLVALLLMEVLRNVILNFAAGY